MHLKSRIVFGYLSTKYRFFFLTMASFSSIRHWIIPGLCIFSYILRMHVYSYVFGCIIFKYLLFIYSIWDWFVGVKFDANGLSIHYWHRSLIIIILINLLNARMSKFKMNSPIIMILVWVFIWIDWNFVKRLS